MVGGADPATFEVKEDRIQTLSRDANQCFSGLSVVTWDALSPKGQAYCRYKRSALLGDSGPLNPNLFAISFVRSGVSDLFCVTFTV